MSDVETCCTRCGVAVAEVMSGPPDRRDTWWRYRVHLTHRATVMRFSMFKRQWLPADPADQVRETYTLLNLCDPCARAVLLFAQTTPADSTRAVGHE